MKREKERETRAKKRIGAPVTSVTGSGLREAGEEQAVGMHYAPAQLSIDGIGRMD